jgi:hypothetical protein
VTLQGALASYHVARLLLLIDAYSRNGTGIAGLTKLAKLDFLLRYPTMLGRLLNARGLAWPEGSGPDANELSSVESQMIRWKYGPWDNLYYPLIGSLLSLELTAIQPASVLTLRSTTLGAEMASQLRGEDPWRAVDARCHLLHQHFNMTGNALRRLIYEELPEVRETQFGRPI